MDSKLFSSFVGISSWSLKLSVLNHPYFTTKNIPIHHNPVILILLLHLFYSSQSFILNNSFELMIHFPHVTLWASIPSRTSFPLVSMHHFPDELVHVAKELIKAGCDLTLLVHITTTLTPSSVQLQMHTLRTLPVSYQIPSSLKLL